MCPSAFRSILTWSLSVLEFRSSILLITYWKSGWTRLLAEDAELSSFNISAGADCPEIEAIYLPWSKEARHLLIPEPCLSTFILQQAYLSADRDDTGDDEGLSWKDSERGYGAGQVWWPRRPLNCNESNFFLWNWNRNQAGQKRGVWQSETDGGGRDEVVTEVGWRHT